MTIDDQVQFVQEDEVRAWYTSSSLTGALQSIGAERPDPEYVENLLQLPPHLAFVLERLAAERGQDVPARALDSIPFFSLCHGLFLPLSGLAPERASQIFRIL